MSDQIFDLNIEKILACKKELTRGCEDCSNDFYKLCPAHSVEFFDYLNHVKSNIPFGYVRSFMNEEMIEKKCREYDPVRNCYSKPFDCHANLVNSYIDKLDSAVIENGYSFFFYGANGGGKTHTALYILFKAIQLGMKGYYLPFRDLVTLYNKSEFLNEKDSRDLYRYIINCDFLVVDEVGKESSVTDNLLGSFEQIIKHRTSILKPTILVSNIDFPSEEEGFLVRYGNSVANSIMEHYRILNFSREGDFRVKLRKKWEI
jgi:DNA replication protein DnaC